MRCQSTSIGKRPEEKHHLHPPRKVLFKHSYIVLQEILLITKSNFQWKDLQRLERFSSDTAVLGHLGMNM